MEIVPGPVIVEPATNRQATQSQPIQALANLDAPLDDAQVRAAIANAEANNQDPQTIKLDELAQAPVTNPPAPAPTPAPVEVPQKFLKPDGAVDVEKIQASTRQLDEAVQAKEAKLNEANKSVDDLLNHYLDLEKRLRTTPNPEKIMAQLPQTPPQVSPPQMTDAQLFQMINEDMKNNPAATVAQLVEIAIAKRLQPLEEKDRIGTVRENIAALAKKDPRVLNPDLFQAITRKIESDPDIRSRRNPHRAAWLEVKEELRLGELTSAQAQPSKPLSPVLGGGTPPSVPSSSSQSPQSVLDNLDRLDLKDRKQEALGDEAIRALLQARR